MNKIMKIDDQDLISDFDEIPNLQFLININKIKRKYLCL